MSNETIELKQIAAYIKLYPKGALVLRWKERTGEDVVPNAETYDRCDKRFAKVKLRLLFLIPGIFGFLWAACNLDSKDSALGVICLCLCGLCYAASMYYLLQSRIRPEEESAGRALEPFATAVIDLDSALKKSGHEGVRYLLMMENDAHAVEFKGDAIYTAVNIVLNAEEFGVQQDRTIARVRLTTLVKKLKPFFGEIDFGPFFDSAKAARQKPQPRKQLAH